MHHCARHDPRYRLGGVCLLPIPARPGTGCSGIAVSWTPHNLLLLDWDRYRTYRDTQQTMNTALGGVCTRSRTRLSRSAPVARGWSPAAATRKRGMPMTAIPAATAARGDYRAAAASGMDRAIRVPTADDPRRRSLPLVRTAGPAITPDRSPAMSPSARTVRSWPLLILAAPAAAEVWSGWVGIAQKTGFGLVSPLPGIWSSLHLDTSITLPVGVEAYAAYALRAWLASGHSVSRRTRRFAKWSAICSFGIGMAGQVAYHLLEQAGAARAPWAITTAVSCLPVLVLAMGTALAHMLRTDAVTGDAADAGTGGPAILRSPDGSPEGQAQPHRDQPGRVRRPGPVLRPKSEGPRGETTAQPCEPPGRPPAPRSRKLTRPALSPAGLPLPGSQYPGEPCAAAESRAPMNP